MTNPLLQLGEAGQAVCLDFLNQKILENGELQQLIDQDGIKGLTSNPSIFEKSIGEGDDYDARLKAALDKADAEVIDLYEGVAIADIQAAADRFRPVYDRLHGRDGYVSLEVSPYLAMDTQATIAEARRLWRAVDRPNLMVKVPGTAPGVPAIRQLIGEGININVTLLFSIDAYLAVADAHMGGLEALKARGGDVSRVHGVASFFVSRIDGKIDKEIDQRLQAGAGGRADELKRLRGKVAIANAKIAYQRYLEMVQSPRWKALADAGAAPQRLLWASTGTKDPAYSDVLYVESLIGADTVNTAPPKTIDAFRDHGRVQPALTEGVDEAREVLASADRLGLDLNGVTSALVVDGVEQFATAFDKLLGAVADKRAKILGDRLNLQSMTLPADLQAAVDDVLERARAEGWVRRLWARDASLWTKAGEDAWLGWLDAGEGETVDQVALSAFRAEIKATGFGHALLMGMGGSSLAPEVLAKTFGSAPGSPELLVLDSTDPDQIRRTEDQIDLASTLFIVSSKSGTTLEPSIFHGHFFYLAAGKLGAVEAASRFIAITDPGSQLEQTARTDGFRRIFPGDPSIGGRYSALSNFGMVPAAVIGLDTTAFLAATRTMTRACGSSVPPLANPGFLLGAALGAAGKAGRDKITIIASEGISDLGAWLEQLLAESTGKLGKGLIPIDAEPVGPPGVYGDDRLFVDLRLAGQDDPERDAAIDALEDAGRPVVRIVLASVATLGQEFFRWEMATAVAGAVLGLDPFDQPDVEAAKIKARALMDAFEQKGGLPAETPILRTDGIELYTDPRNAAEIAKAVGAQTLEAYLEAHFERAHAGDYIALLAYLDRNAEHIAVLEKIRARIRDRKRLATALGFGPRYLHSTGQAYKGGPNSGVFLEITAKPTADIKVYGRGYGFGDVEAAQARGDFAALEERGRRLLRIDLGQDVQAGLKRLADAIDRVLA